MINPIMAKCDDCGKEFEQADMYDAPWRDDKVRCTDCFLLAMGYDPEVVNEWAARTADFVRQCLAEMAHEHATQKESDR